MTIDESKERKRMVVEEVGEIKPEVNSSEPLEEIKEKAQEIENLADEAAAPVEAPVPPTFPVQPSFQQNVSPGVNPLVIIIPGIFILGGLLGGIFFYQSKVSGKSQGNLQPTDSPTVSPVSAVATSTPKAEEVDLTKYSVSILNGSGIAGEAGKVQDLIEEAGFKVSGTGNATSYDYTKTVIQAKSDVDKDFLSKLSETLGKNYSVETKVEELEDSSKDSVVIIVGSTKK